MAYLSTYLFIYFLFGVKTFRANLMSPKPSKKHGHGKILGVFVLDTDTSGTSHECPQCVRRELFIYLFFIKHSQDIVETWS